MKYIIYTILALFFIACNDNKSSDKIQDTSSWKDEPYYKYMWHINSQNSILNTLGYNISENADINLSNILDITQGENIKVAIIDGSFDVEHEDLKENIISTYNIDANTFDVTNHSTSPSHGNSCAGLIASPINNKGIIGIAPKAKLILIKQTYNNDADTIKAFEYAKNQGAKVVSCSWGTEDVSDAVAEEIKSLYDANITVVFAAGNDNKSLDEDDINDESELPWVIGVGSSNELNEVSFYSNYGSNIDLYAPGGNIDYMGVLTIDDSNDKGDTNQKNLVTNNYTFVEGTSFSAPIVAGVVALMYSVNPNLTVDNILEILKDTSTIINEKNKKINAYQAVIKAKENIF